MSGTYLFDLDGTLVDTAPDLHNALNFALGQVDIAPVGIDLTRHWVGHGAKKMISCALQQRNEPSPSIERIETLYHYFIEYYRDHIAVLSRPFSGVRLAIHHFAQQNFKLGVVTNKRYELSTLLLQELELLDCFQIVVGGDTLSVAKPEPDPLLHACRTLDTLPAHAIFVGDSDTDVRCARAAGCPVVLVPYGYSQGISISTLGADGTIESLVNLI